MSEREVQHEPQVLAGEDELPRQPATPLDPYTPEPSQRPGEGRAWAVMRLAWIPLLVVIVVLVIVGVRS